MAKNKKLIASVAAVATSAALLLGGTLAWQSTNQTALNEASDVINPGGRLHDDFDGENKDVYVENFADENIYARIRLEEYFEIITNYGKEGAEKSHKLVGDKTIDEETGEVDYTYKLFTGYANMQDGVVSAASHTDENSDETTSYWSWQTGGSTVYMPTFNLNKDSLLADVNGIYEEGNVGTISNRFDPDDPQYTEYTDYAELGVGHKETANELYDGDANDIDEFTDGGNGNVELADIIANGENSAYYANYESSIELVANQEHTAADTLDAELISMAEWLGMVEYDENGDPANLEYLGNYWVYDEDGWVYWSAPIKPHTATGLLLNGIELNQVMDDTWYYAINVIAQFVTADDVGKSDGTGFYGVEKEKPSENAEKLLGIIGVEIPEEKVEESDFAITWVDSTNANFNAGYPWFKNGSNTLQLGATIVRNGVTETIPAADVTWTVSPESQTYEEIGMIATTHTINASITEDEDADTLTIEDDQYEGLASTGVFFTVTATYGEHTATKDFVYSDASFYQTVSIDAASHGLQPLSYEGATVGNSYQFTRVFRFNETDLSEHFETEWLVTDADGNTVEGATISDNGLFTTTVPGDYKIIARIAGYPATEKNFVVNAGSNEVFTVKKSIINQIAETEYMIGTVAAGGNNTTISSINSKDQILIDGEKYFVVTRDENKKEALLISAAGTAVYQESTATSSTAYSNIKYGATNYWPESYAYKFLNGTESIVMPIGSSYGTETAAIASAEVTPFLATRPFIEEHALETTYYINKIDTSGTTYEQRASQIFLLSQADIAGKTGTADADARDYTYSGIRLIEQTLDQNTALGYSWLRSAYNATNVAYNASGTVLSTHPTDGVKSTGPSSRPDMNYAYYWGYVYPAFRIDISSADKYQSTAE